MQLLTLKYKLHGKTFKSRVTYQHSANIIAGLLISGAEIYTAIGETPAVTPAISEYSYDQLLDETNAVNRPRHHILKS